MPKGKLKQQTANQRAKDKALEWLSKAGASKEVLEQIKDAEIKKPAETADDKIREIQSVIYWFATDGWGFKEKLCKECRKIFAYKWNVDSISYCSIKCAADSLKRNTGIEWNPDKNPAERWGKYAPAVVPPEALQKLRDLRDQLNDSLIDPLSQISPEELQQSQD